MSEVCVRKFVPDDLDAVTALWNRVFGYPEPRNEPARVIADKLAFDDLLLVAVDGEQLIGTIMLGYDGHRGWLYRAAVAESARRSGVGRALVRRAEAALAALGCAKINLQLHAHNEAGARFWQALGYSVEPRISMGKNTFEPPAGGAPPGAGGAQGV
jgi:ribosomal protein S18 acetylase RimI-like enzyme